MMLMLGRYSVEAPLPHPAPGRSDAFIAYALRSFLGSRTPAKVFANRPPHTGHRAGGIHDGHPHTESDR